MHQWVKALEELRIRKKVSKNSLHEAGVIRRSQYNTMLRAKKGVRIDVLERILLGLGVTWHDWADVYGKIGSTRGLSIAEARPRYGTKRATKIQSRASPRKKAG
jgi:transcriptional regulator with XRE-family HTH domain